MSEKKFQARYVFKKFQKHFILGGSLAFLAILVIAFMSGSKPEVEKPKPVIKETFSAVTDTKTSPAEVVTQHINNFEANQAKINEQLVAKVAEIESQNAMLRQHTQEVESQAAKVNDKLALLSKAPAVNSSSPVKAYVAPKPQNVVFEDDIEDTSPANASAPIAASKDASNSYSNSTEKEEPVKEASTYIPSNSFVKGVLIGSLSANTGGNANQDPTPVLIRITDMAQLPNRFRSNLKSCMVGGSGWGDLSTERVKIRLTTLSCIMKSGKSLDMKVAGYVDGEDSKAGIRGMVVTHSGNIAAKAAMAGFLQGVGQVGQAMGQTQQITPLGGVTTTVSPSQALYAGGGSGVAQVGSSLSTYYMNMLNQISPSIEVSAGRHITVIFTEGIELKLPINEVYNNNQPLPMGEEDAN